MEENEVEVRESARPEKVAQRNRKSPRKGSQGLRVTDREYSALLFLLVQKFASREQLYRAVWNKAGSRSSKYAWDRIRALEKAGLIESFIPFGRSCKYYKICLLGFNILEGFYSNITLPLPIRGVNYAQFEHDDLLNECRLKLFESQISTSWKSERQIVSDLLRDAHGEARMGLRHIAYKRAPDGVFRHKDGSWRAFELELKPKSKVRYQEKVMQLSQDMNGEEALFDGVLFICREKRVSKVLKALTSEHGERFRVMGLDEFLTQTTETPTTATTTTRGGNNE